MVWWGPGRCFIMSGKASNSCQQDEGNTLRSAKYSCLAQSQYGCWTLIVPEPGECRQVKRIRCPTRESCESSRHCIRSDGQTPRSRWCYPLHSLLCTEDWMAFLELTNHIATSHPFASLLWPLLSQVKGCICLHHIRALFLFDGLTQEVAFHLNIVLQGLLALSKVAKVCVGKLSLLLPHVAVAHSNAWEQGEGTREGECPNI